MARSVGRAPDANPDGLTSGRGFRGLSNFYLPTTMPDSWESLQLSGLSARFGLNFYIWIAPWPVRHLANPPLLYDYCNQRGPNVVFWLHEGTKPS
jgi:hypothetical protein